MKIVTVEEQDIAAEESETFRSLATENPNPFEGDSELQTLLLRLSSEPELLIPVWSGLRGRSHKPYVELEFLKRTTLYSLQASFRNPRILLFIVEGEQCLWVSMLSAVWHNSDDQLSKDISGIDAQEAASSIIMKEECSIKIGCNCCSSIHIKVTP